MPVNAILAPDLDANLNQAMGLEPSFPAMVHAVALWALPAIQDNYVRQEARIKERIREAEVQARERQADVQRRARLLRAGAIGAGTALALALAAASLLAPWQAPGPGLSVLSGGASLILLVVAGLILIGAVVLGLWFGRQGARQRRSIAEALEGETTRLLHIEGDLEPDAVLRVGRVYWAFELVQHPNGARIPVNLAAAARADAVRLACPGAVPSGSAEKPQGKASGEDGLAALARIQADLARWQVDEEGLRLPLLPGEGEQARQLERELRAMVGAAEPATNGVPGPLLGPGGVIAGANGALDEGAPLYTAGWQRCLASGERWRANLSECALQASQAAARAVDAFRAKTGGQKRPAAAAQALLSDWVALQEERPETSALLAELRSRRAGLEERLQSGIEPEAEARLLEELRQVLQEVYQKPWTRVVEPVEQLNRAHARAAEELRSLGLQLAAVSAQDSTIRDREYTVAQTERRIQELGTQVARMGGEFDALHRDAGALLESVRQLQADLGKRIPPRIGDTALDPRPVERQMASFQEEVRRARRELDRARGQDGASETHVVGLVGLLEAVSGQGQELLRLQSEYARHWEQAYQEVKGAAGSIEKEVRQWRDFQREVQRYGQEGQAALRPLQSLETGLQDLQSSIRAMWELLQRYLDLARESYGGLRELVAGSDAIVHRLDGHLEERDRALAKQKRDLDRLQTEYYGRIAREKARVSQEIQGLEARQARVEWMARDAENLVAELAGCPVERIARQWGLPPGDQIQAAIANQVEGAIEAVRSKIEDECERRMEAIRAAQDLAERALQIAPGSAVEADLLLLPLWYVEWRETLDPERPEEKRYRYRLALPLGIVEEKVRRVPGEVYPALARYLQELPDLGAWEGEFAMGGEPAGALAARVRTHACLQEVEIEALAVGMRAAVARHVYPRGYDEMVAKSRDDLSEWGERVGTGVQCPAGRGGA